MSQQATLNMKPCPYSMRNPEKPYCFETGCIVWDSERELCKRENRRSRK